MNVSDGSASGPNPYVMAVYAGEDTANGYAVHYVTQRGLVLVAN